MFINLQKLAFNLLWFKIAPPSSLVKQIMMQTNPSYDPPIFFIQCDLVVMRIIHGEWVFAGYIMPDVDTQLYHRPASCWQHSPACMGRLVQRESTCDHCPSPDLLCMTVRRGKKAKKNYYLGSKWLWHCQHCCLPWKCKYKQGTAHNPTWCI